MKVHLKLSGAIADITASRETPRNHEQDYSIAERRSEREREVGKGGNPLAHNPAERKEVGKGVHPSCP